jgi:hypothetical protein
LAYFSHLYLSNNNIHKCNKKIYNNTKSCYCKSCRRISCRNNHSHANSCRFLFFIPVTMTLKIICCVRILCLTFAIYWPAWSDWILFNVKRWLPSGVDSSKIFSFAFISLPFFVHFNSGNGLPGAWHSNVHDPPWFTRISTGSEEISGTSY